MSEGGIVRLTNISDFIAPNPNCIIPLETRTVEEPLVAVRKKQRNEDKPKKGAIKISLNDCLACSGCITSAETVLVEEQSLMRAIFHKCGIISRHAEGSRRRSAFIRDALKADAQKLLDGFSEKKLCVVTVSPQSVCSIAVKRHLTLSETAKLISSFFFSKGAHYVIDSSFGRWFALEEAYNEYLSVASRPILVSACPGIVCYAEKSNDGLLIPFMSKVRSPQAISGALVKDYLSRKLGIPVSSIYHASVMMCFDKKLEASRPDFHVHDTEIRETDCVISTVEIDSLLDEVDTLVEAEDPGWLGDFSRGILYGNEGGTAGGFVDVLVRKFVEENGGKVSEKRIARNVDSITVIREDEVLLRGARIYGFRNIQNLVRKMKNNKTAYDCIEVMACPSACGNGGAQIRGETAEDRERILNAVEEKFARIKNDASLEARKVAESWSQLNPEWRTLLYTDYHKVDTNIAQKLQW